jgi:hypothetical protein
MSRWKNDNVQDDRPPKDGVIWEAPKPQILQRKPRLYLAYGSNLNKRDMRIRCPGAVTKGKVIWLEDARLVFRGVADVEIIPNHVCPTGLWLITPENERTLDRYEGVAGGLYTKEEVDLGKGKSALIYLMSAQGIYPPSLYYYNCLKQGYRDFRIPFRHLEAARDFSFEGKEPCEHTIARRKRQRASSHQQKLVPMPEALAQRQLALRMQYDDVDARLRQPETSECESTG